MSGKEPAVPGGFPVVGQWVTDLYGDRPSAGLWTVLDERLRLALAQAWVLNVLGRPDDVVAADLVASRSGDAVFATFLADQIAHWRQVYKALRNGFGLVGMTELVVANMELVVLTTPEYAGTFSAGASIPAHSFITRIGESGWSIAALARRLPIPGWPPSAERIPGLSIDSPSGRQ